jgi:Ni/Co efflux regulator RcnB
MRRIVLTLVALAVGGFTLPIASNTASAREVVVIKKHNHGRHLGWIRHEGWRHEGWRHHDRDRVVIRKYD